MLRGSRPGERRGGRKRGTPNRRTILSDRILSIGLDQPAASQHAFLLKLVQDQKLPADIRMAVAPKCFPPNRTRSSWRGRPRALAGIRTTNVEEALATADSAVASKGAQVPTGISAIREWAPHAIDALFGVVQDGTADLRARRKAALKITEFLLPKVGKKAKVIPDEYGFVINLSLISAYREIERKLQGLVNGPARKIPAIAEKIKKLEARSDAIRRRLQLPCPTKYGDKEVAVDRDRLLELCSRLDGIPLTEAHEAEAAHLMSRLVVFHASPESIARHRRKALEVADRQFRMSRLFGDFYAAPLSRKERNELKVSRWLYPEPKGDLSGLDGDERFDPYHHHPFSEELRAPNGNFYPRHSKLRWLEQLGKIKEDAEEQQKPELLGKSRMHELEERRVVGFELTAPEEQDLRDLRARYPKFAAVMDLMDLPYLYQWRREVEIARKAGLDTVAMFEQADVVCLRCRDRTKFTTESDAEEYLRVLSGKGTEAAAVEL